MGKLKVLTFLNIKKDHKEFRKVKTDNRIPNILTFLSSTKEDKIASLARKNSLQKMKTKGIEEEYDDDESKEDRDNRHERMSGSSGTESSIDGDLDLDEEQLYNDLSKMQEDQEKDQKCIVDELMDLETIQLLRLCSKFKIPNLEDLSDKFVTFGEKTRYKVLVLDMDETLIHAKFLTDPSEEVNDDGDFIVSIASS
jgi:hypothetical protein